MFILLLFCVEFDNREMVKLLERLGMAFVLVL